jgi:hypothetical protein
MQAYKGRIMKHVFMIVVITLILLLLADSGDHHRLLLPSPSTRPPSAPSNLTAQPVSQSEVELHWCDNSNNEDGFRIYRSIVAAIGNSLNDNETQSVSVQFFSTKEVGNYLKIFVVACERDEGNFVPQAFGATGK